ASALEVLREELGLLLLDLGEALSERARHLAVQEPAARSSERLVGRVANDRVLEEVALRPRAPAGVDEAGVHQLAHILAQQRVLARYGAQNVVAELAAEHRGELARVARARREAVEAGSEEVPQAAGNLDRRGADRLRFGEGPGFDENAGDLLDEERDAVGLSYHTIEQRAGE